MAFALDSIIHIHVHELEDEGKSTRRLIIEDFVELDYLWVRAEPTQRLNLSQIINLLDCVEMVLHALDGNVLARFDTLSLEHLREGTFTFLGY